MLCQAAQPWSATGRGCIRRKAQPWDPQDFKMFSAVCQLRCLLLSIPWEFGTQRPITNGEASIVPVGWWFSNVFFHSKGAAPTQSNEMWGRSFFKWCSKDSTRFVKQFELLFGYTVTSDMCSYWKHLASDSSDQMTIVNSLIWTRPAFVEFCRIRWYVRAKR